MRNRSRALPRTDMNTPRADATRSALPASAQPGAGSDRRGEWYRQPVLWLGAVLFAASLGGCVLMIVLGARYADEALPTAGGTSFKVPLARPPAPQDPPGKPQ